MSAFFKLIDMRPTRASVSVRLSEVVAVLMPAAASNTREWHVDVHLRTGITGTIGGTMEHCYKQRDELMHALEQDALNVTISSEGVNTEELIAALRQEPAPEPNKQDRTSVYGKGDD